MLVLSRRLNEKIVFPTINTTLKIVSMKSGVVRVGIDAPEHVPVYREELLADLPPTEPEPDLRTVLHQVNNRLNSSTIGLALLRRQLELGRYSDMAGTINRLDEEVALLRETVAVAEKSPTTRRALLVEDDKNECELLAAFLRLAGLEVTTAGDGADALDYLRANGRPDVVVLDMILPRCDGPTTVREIRNNPEHSGLKIIGVTGADPTRFGLPEGPTGIDRWFHKPLNPEALLRELQ